MADLDYYGADYGAEEPSRFLDAVRDFGFANWAGAITSVGLTAGLAVWAVDMTLRDVSGVPVIAALEGPMREAPANPGGTVAPFQGLALSDITSGGSAAPAPEQIVLAPPAVLLDAPALSERMAVAMQVEETEAEVAIVEAPVVAEVEVMSMQDAVRLALAEAVGDGSLPADGQPASALVDPTAMPASTEPGLARSMRPRSRPQRLSRIAAMAPATLPTEAPTQQPGTQVASLGVISLPMRDAVDLAPGTRVAQLGDFESEADARAEWDRMAYAFRDQMQGKQRLVEKATSGGRDFWRLRVAGFQDGTEARRFCSQLLARDATCIPVTIR